MKSEFVRILINLGFSDMNAAECAVIFTLNSLEGVYSHGVNRFPRFVGYIKDGYINPDAIPTLVHSAGSLEQWDGNLGPGPLNAVFSTERALHLAHENGIGLVALANTNHWMRGGTYGWQAARKGFIFIGWTNTEANMPAWESADVRLGNNPLIFAVPFKDEAIVLDFAMTQYSYGKMELYQIEGKKLPWPGGFDKSGKITDDPSEILESRRALPIGYWKGAGLSLLLDILASVLSAGLSAHEISRKKAECCLSQVFIAINLEKLHNFTSIESTVQNIIDDLKRSVPENENSSIRFPGENVVRTRIKNQMNGIPVNKEVWEKIISL